MTMHGGGSAAIASALVGDELGDASIAVAEPETRGDLAHLVVGLLAIALLVIGTVGWVAGSAPMKGVGLLLFALLGFGPAMYQLSEGVLGLRFLAYGLAGSVVLMLLTGFVLVELRLWTLGIAVFVIYACPSVAAHVVGVRRHWSARSAPWSLLRTSTASSLAVGSLAMSLVGAALSLGSAIESQHLVLRLSGILGALPVLWYLGLASVVASIILSRNLPGWQLGLSVSLLVVVLTFTPAIVFDLPVYPWTAKHVGLVNYFVAHGAVRPGIGPGGGIYQSWPALFAGVAWLCHVVGNVDPWTIARWWPPMIDLLALVGFRQLASKVGLPARHAWIAATLFFLGNTIGQDYFSPQSVAFFLAIIVFGIAYRERGSLSVFARSEWVLFAGAVLAITFTHQLTPFMITVAVLVMTLFGYARSRWMPVVAVVPALVWTGLHYSSVDGFLGLNVVGDVSRNISTPGARNASLRNDIYVHLSVVGQAGSLLLVGLLALAVLLRWRTRKNFMLALCAASGGGLLLVSSYGNEGLFRVGLFALPWLALLALSGDWKSKRQRAAHGRAPRSLMQAVILGALPVMVVLYLWGAMGIDYGYEIRPGDVAAINYFERTADRGAVLVSIGYGSNPNGSTGIYKNFNHEAAENLVQAGQYQGRFDATRAIDELTLLVDPGRPGQNGGPAARRADVYVLVSAEAAAESELRGLITPAQYAQIVTALEKSPYWMVVARTDSATLFKLS